MHLTYLCTHCKKTTKCDVYELDRVILIQRHGETIDQTCKHCYKPSRVAATHIRAAHDEWLDYTAYMVQLVLFGLGVVLWWGLSRFHIITAYGYMTLVFVFIGMPQTIIAVIRANETAKVRLFNAHI